MVGAGSKEHSNNGEFSSARERNAWNELRALHQVGGRYDGLELDGVCALIKEMGMLFKALGLADSLAGNEAHASRPVWAPTV